MSTDIGRPEQAALEGPERGRRTSTAAPVPDPEVTERARRRHFSTQEELRILEGAVIEDACRQHAIEPGQLKLCTRTRAPR